MAKFMFLQRGGSENRPKMTPEQMQQEMQTYMDWMQVTVHGVVLR